MVVDLQQNVESINVTMSCPWGEQPQQLRAALKKDRRKPKVPAAVRPLHILPPSSPSTTFTPFLGTSALQHSQGCSPHSIPWCNSCRYRASPSQRTAAITGRGSASCPTQLRAPSALGAPQAAAGSLRRSQPPSARGEARSVLTPHTHSPKKHCPGSGGSLQLWVAGCPHHPPVPAGPTSPWR